MWVREDLSDQGLPIIAVTRNATEALPCKGSALSLTKLKDVDRDANAGFPQRLIEALLRRRFSLRSCESRDVAATIPDWFGVGHDDLQ
jgi:hypothetical protein